MNDCFAFLRAIRANPDDDTARLVFADWLDEHDDPLGAFIRVQIELEPIRFRIDNPRGVELHAREDELLRRHHDDWVGDVANFPNPADFGPVFRRGLPDYACLSLDTFLTQGDALFAAFPTLREVALFGIANRCSELTLSPLLAKLDTLEIADWPTEDDAISLSVSPHLERISRFKLWIGGEPYFLSELVKQAHTNWPREIELVQVYGGASCRNPETERVLNDEADAIAREANKRLGRQVVRVTRPFERLFPLNGDMGYHLYAGHLPDGTPALVHVGYTDGSWVLVRFDDAGGVRDTTVHPDSVLGPGELTRFAENSFARDVALREWVEEGLRLELGLIWVREFVGPENVLQLWHGVHVERLANPHRLDDHRSSVERESMTGEVRGWLEQRHFVTGSWNYLVVDWRGKIHSS